MFCGKVVSTLLMTTMLVFALATAGYALHPEPQIPEKVEINHQACHDLAAIAKKYGVEGIFPKDFEEGKQQYLNRIELASSTELLTEKLAEKVIKEGANAVGKEDLDKLAAIREELRGEMLLVHTRMFQQRNEELGTLLHPLTSRISLSGQMVGVFQSSVGQKRDHSAVVGRGDVVFNFKISDTTTAVIDIEATGGDGLDPHIPNFSGLNGVAGSTNDRVRFRQAWVEQSLFNDRMLATIGKIDLANYFDANAVANDENSQFLSGAFVNAHALSLPDPGPGARLQVKLAEPLVFGIGYGSGNVDADGVPTGNDILDHGFSIAELDYKHKLGELEGNFRVYGAIDAALPDNAIKIKQKNAYNYGISIDQQLTGKLSIFGRYAQRERSIYLTNRSWSAGLQYTGLIPARPDDVTAIAYGQISGHTLAAQEKLLEWYYKMKVIDKISISTIVQWLMQPEGNPDRDNAVVLGLRSQVNF